MSRSAADSAEVPPGVVTVTSTTPLPAGATAFNVPPETYCTETAGNEPNRTTASERNLLPVIDTVAPPAARTKPGLMAVTTGGSTYTYCEREEPADTPPGVRTVTGTPAATCAGAV